MCQAEKAFVFEQPYRKRVGSVETDVCHSYLSYTIGIQKMNTGEAMAASIMFMPILIIMINIWTKSTLKQEG